jgi:endonuclease YncB( thermonuclease family)
MSIRVLDDQNLTIGIMALGMRGNKTGTVKQIVHDGDTLNVRPDGNLGVRFLGIDTPEVSFSFPKTNRFVPLSDPRWDEFLSDPFAETWGEINPPLPEGLKRHLRSKLGRSVAASHLRHARAAEDFLEEEISKDMKALGQDAETFRFFLAFAFEVMDGYGRLLGYLNREQPNPNQPEPRPLTYNERLLKAGRAFPYFIWPNVNPFRRESSILKAVPKPGTQKTLAEGDITLSRTAEFLANARERHLGLFDAMQPMLLEPFELRVLARRERPARWVIDLSVNNDVLIRPENYYQIPSPEHRLFISAEYVPLFVEHGWKRQAE